MPFFAKSPFSCAAQIGQLPPADECDQLQRAGSLREARRRAAARSAVAAAIFLSALTVLRRYFERQYKIIGAARCGSRTSRRRFRDRVDATTARTRAIPGKTLIQ